MPCEGPKYSSSAGRRAERLALVAAEHSGIAPVAADVGKPADAERVIDAAASRSDRLDVLVNNAGMFAVLPLEYAECDRVGELLAVNVLAPTLLTRAALPYLREVGGTVVNVSSSMASRSAPGAGHYAATKAALESLTRSWAVELAPSGVRVNAVAPGPAESEALEAAGLSAEMVEQIKREEASGIPLGRRGEPTEVASWILALAAPGSAWVTGQVLGVDGGHSII